MKALEPLIQDTLRRGAAQPHVYPRDIAALEIHLPALEDQRRIATVLDAAYTMRTKRRRALAKLDTLTQAIYIDMFGDPRTPTAKWARLELGEAGTIHTGKTPPGNKAGMFGEDVPFVTPGDLEADRQPARWLSLRGVDHVRVVPEGSTLVCCIGATIGKVGEARRPSAFNQQINAIDWDRSRVDPSFGTQTMRFLGTDVARLGASTTMPILKKSSFAKMLVPVPPLTEQREFASRRAVVALRRHEMRSSREILDQLFASLQQRAFRGEL
jgi:type I restriction enzyme S subunit